MLYRVVARRVVWKKVKDDLSEYITESRLDFKEETNLEYNDFYRVIMAQFKGWVFSVSTLKEVR